MLLTDSHTYSADITLNVFQRIASNDQVKAEFEKYGFRNVVITGEGKLRKAKGTYFGVTQEAKLDSRISNIKVI